MSIRALYKMHNILCSTKIIIMHWSHRWTLACVCTNGLLFTCSPKGHAHTQTLFAVCLIFLRFVVTTKYFFSIMRENGEWWKWFEFREKCIDCLSSVDNWNLFTATKPTHSIMPPEPLSFVLCAFIFGLTGKDQIDRMSVNKTKIQTYDLKHPLFRQHHVVLHTHFLLYRLSFAM